MSKKLVCAPIGEETKNELFGYLKFQRGMSLASKDGLLTKIGPIGGKNGFVLATSMKIIENSMVRLASSSFGRKFCKRNLTGNKTCKSTNTLQC